jgi:hypothetical protein
MDPTLGDGPLGTIETATSFFGNRIAAVGRQLKSMGANAGNGKIVLPDCGV